MKSNININMELDNSNNNGELSEELEFSIIKKKIIP